MLWPRGRQPWDQPTDAPQLPAAATAAVDANRRIGCSFNAREIKLEGAFFKAGEDHPAHLRQLLLRAGDVESNPGPRRSQRLIEQRLANINTQQTMNLNKEKEQTNNENESVSRPAKRTSNHTEDKEQEKQDTISETLEFVTKHYEFDLSEDELDATNEIEDQDTTLNSTISEVIEHVKKTTGDTILQTKNKNEQEKLKRMRIGKNNKLKICIWNAGGLKRKKENLELLCEKESIDVIMVQKAKFQGKKPLKILNFNEPVVQRRKRGRLITNNPELSGDVAIYTRKGVSYETIPIAKRPFEQSDDTTEWCGVKVFGRNEEIILHNIYRPPVRSGDSDDRPNNFSTDKWDPDMKTIYAGDFNSHHPLWDNACSNVDDTGEKIAEWCARNEYLPLNDGSATRKDSNTAPDAAFCHMKLAPYASWTLAEDAGSDHTPMIVTIRMNGATEKTIRKTKWRMEKANWEGYRADTEKEFDELNEKMLENHMTVDAIEKQFREIIQRGANSNIPKGCRKTPRPWLENKPELLKLIEDRNEKRRRSNESRQAQALYIQARQDAANAIATAKQEAWREFATTLSAQTDPRKVSRVIKTLDDNVCEDGSAQILRNAAGKPLTTPKEQGNALIKNYAATSRLPPRPCDKKLTKFVNKKLSKKQQEQPSNICRKIEMEELKYHVKMLKLGKAAGPDGIVAEMLINLGTFGYKVLLGLLERCWMDERVPDAWRRAIVIPIFKNGKNPSELASYRPISLTSHAAKLMERIIRERLYTWCEAQNILPAEQSAFRQGKSTEDSIAEIVQNIQDGWERPLPRKKVPGQCEKAARTCLLAFDFAKAFDRVWKRGLYYKLIKWDVPLKMIRWIRAFLSNRRACCQVNGVKSINKKFSEGLPQGSVLSPLLFIIFLADLGNKIKEQAGPRCRVTFYADDTTVSCQGTTVTEALEISQNAADAFSSWARRWKMQIAPQKTQLMIFTQLAGEREKGNIWVHGHKINAQHTIKILGVTLDRLLHMGAHCKEVRAKTCQRLNQLNQVCNRQWGTEEKTREILVKSYIDGVIFYAGGAWMGAASKSHLEVLERIRRQAARLQTGCTLATPVNALMAEANMVSMPEKVKALCTILFEKAMRAPPSSPLNQLIVTAPKQRLQSVSGWRKVGFTQAEKLGLNSILRDCSASEYNEVAADVQFSIMENISKEECPEERKRKAEKWIATNTKDESIRIWSDGSAISGTSDGGAGVLIEYPDKSTLTFSAPAGKICSSTSAELKAIQLGLEQLDISVRADITIFLDSQAAILSLKRGYNKQKERSGKEIWKILQQCSTASRAVDICWIPSHCGIEKNEAADVAAKAGTRLDQKNCEVSLPAATKYVKRRINEDSTSTPEGWHHELYRGRKPPIPAGPPRQRSVIHQLRTGHCPLLAAEAHKISAKPSQACQGCRNEECAGAECPDCHQGPQTARHFLLQCPQHEKRRLEHGVLGAEAMSEEYIGVMAKWLLGRPGRPPAH